MLGVADLSDKIGEAKAAGDFLTARKLQKQQLDDVYASLLTDEAAQDPSGNSPVWANPQMGAADYEVAMSAFLMQNTRRNLQIQEALNNSNWKNIAAFGDSIIERYKAQNKADVIGPMDGLTPEEYARQFQPVMVDPNEIANWRQQLVKLDNQMKQFGGSVFTHPTTARIAKIIATDAGQGTPGYAASKDQDITKHMNLAEKVLLPVRFGAEAFAEELIDLGVGTAATLERLGSLAINGMSGGQGAAYYNQPTGWVQDRDGQWYHNGGKVSAGLFLAGVWHSLTGQALDQEVARYEQAKEQFVGQSVGVQRIANGVGMAVGQFAAFGAASAPAVNLAMKGMKMLAGAGRTAAKGISMKFPGVTVDIAAGAVGKETIQLGAGSTLTIEVGPKAISRAKEITALLAGQAAGLGAYEAIKNGHIEGYGAAALHGAVMAAPMMLFGALGRGAERMFGRTEKMPKRLAAAMGGAVEGIGWTSLDWDPVWRFVKDPSKQTLADLTEAVLVNSIAMAGLKAAHAPTEVLGSLEARELQGTKLERIKEAGRVEAPEDVAGMATREGVSTESVERLGAAERERAANVGVDTARAEAANTEAKAASDKLEVEARQLDSTHLERLEQRLSMREKVEVLRQMPEGPEKRKLTILHLNAMRGALGKNFADFARTQAERAYDVDLQSMKNTKEMGEAQAVLNALLGSEGKTATDYSTKVKREISPESMAEIEKLTGKPEERPSQQKGIEIFSEQLEREHAESDVEGEFVKPESLSLEGLQEMRAEEYASKLRQDSGEQRFFAEAPPAPPKPPIAGRGEQGLPPSRQPEKITDKTIRLSDITREMEGFEGDEVRMDFRKGVGRSLSKTAAAWFDPLRNTSRYRDAPDYIINQIHEFAHHMDLSARRGISKQFWSDPELRATLEGAASYYPGVKELPQARQAAEGWATFWARYMVEDPRLREETGPGYDKMLSWIAQPAQAKLLNQVKRVMEGFATYRDMGAIERSKKRFHFEGDPKSEQEKKAEGPARKRIMKDLNRAIVDSLAPLREGQEKWLSAAFGKEASVKILKELPIDFNPVRQIDIWRGTSSKITERFMTQNVTDINGNVVGEGYKQIIQSIPKGREQEFWGWMGAQKDRISQEKGRDTHLSREDIITVLGKQGSAEFQDVADRLKSFWGGMRDLMVESGVYSQEQADRIFSSYEYYVPFEPVIETVAGRGSGRPGDPVKHLKGGAYEVKDPVQAVTNVVQAMIAKAQQTMVLKSALKYEAAIEQQGNFITEVEKGVVPQNISIANFIRALEQHKTGEKDDKTNLTIEEATKKLDELLASGEIGDALVTFTQQTFPKGTKPIIAMKLNLTDAEVTEMESLGARGKHWASRNGKVIWLEMEADTYEAMLGLDVPKIWMDHSPPLARAFVELPAAAVRLGATGVSGTFTATQVAIDSMFSSLRDKHRPTWTEPLGFLYGLWGYMRGAWMIGSGHPDAKLYRNLGGYIATLSGHEIQGHRTASELMGGKKGVWSQLQRGMLRYGEILSTIESSPRVNAFSKELAARREAKQSEREMTMGALEEAELAGVRFTEAGTVTGALRGMTPYLTASIASTNQLRRLLTGKDAVSAGVAWRRLAWSVTVPAIALYWLLKDDKRYQEASEWEKMNYWHIPVPGADDLLKIPKGTVGQLGGSIPVNMWRAFEKSRPDIAKETITDFIVGLIPNWIPATLTPFLEVATGKKMYGQFRDVVPQWMQDAKSPAEQAHPWTAQWAKWAGKLFGLSPLRLESLADTVSGGAIGRASDLAETALRIAKVLDDRPAQASDLPFFAKFTSVAFRSSASVQRVYDLSKELQQGGAPEDRGRLQILNTAKDRMSVLRRAKQQGILAPRVADEQIADIARQALEVIDK